MKKFTFTTRLGLVGVLLVGVGVTPVIPQDTEFLYAYQTLYELEKTIVTATSTYVIPATPYPDNDGNGVVSVVAYKSGGTKIEVQIPDVLYENKTKIGRLSRDVKYTNHVSLASLLLPTSEAAISFTDASTTGTGNVSSFTQQFFVGSTDDFLTVGVSASFANRTISGVTYAGASTTRATTATSVGGDAGFYVALWYLNNPTTANNDLTITVGGGSSELALAPASYDGVDNVAPESNSGVNGAADQTVTVTPTSDNSWHTGWAFNASANQTCVTNCTFLEGPSGGLALIRSTDSPISPAAANSITVGRGGAGNLHVHSIAIPPSAAAAAVPRNIAPIWFGD